MRHSLFLANLILAIHLVIVFVILFGWGIDSIYYLYMAVLAGTLLSELILGYCFLTKWEFDLRKKFQPNLNYDYSFLSYYGYKFVKQRISTKFIKYSALIFLFLSLVVNLIFRRL